ncbi:MAG: rod shape-determining protein MreD [Chitinispirillaceae bacterium]|nr:rod shape-determining protein MreD [Chitinispirillaceae bacterium]
MIGSILRWAALFLACFVLQTTVVPVVSVFGIKPDLLMVLLFFLALRTGQMGAVWVGFFLGLAQDLYTPSTLGQNALAKTVAGFFAGFFNERVMRTDLVFQLVLLVIMFVIHDALFYFVQVTKGGHEGGIVLQELVRATLPRTLYSIVFALVPCLKERFFPTSPYRR